MNKVVDKRANNLGVHWSKIKVGENSLCSEEIEKVVAVDHSIVSARRSTHVKICEGVWAGVIEVVEVDRMNIGVKIVHVHFHCIVEGLMEATISDQLKL